MEGLYGLCEVSFTKYIVELGIELREFMSMLTNHPQLVPLPPPPTNGTLLF